MTQVYPIRLIRLMTGEMLMAGISDGGKLSYVLECPMVLIAVTSSRQRENQIQEVAVMLKNWIEFTADEYKRNSCRLHSGKNTFRHYGRYDR
jgi:hypothetical protein